MAKLSIKAIQERARAIIAARPGGIRYAALIEEIAHLAPDTPKNTISGAIWNLDVTFPQEISKPSRGLFTRADDADPDPVIDGKTEGVAPSGAKVREAEFYEPFGKWLKEELDEATEVVALGGAGLKWKWGTPDVVGTYKPKKRDVVQFPVEIVACEIKIDPQAPVVAFGQAVAYRMFATKTYIAMPTTLTAEDLSRLESLCMLFGVCLVLFELNKDAPRFSIRMRALRFSPDMFYVNEFADRLRKVNIDQFDQLFD